MSWLMKVLTKEIRRERLQMNHAELPSITSAPPRGERMLGDNFPVLQRDSKHLLRQAA